MLLQSFNTETVSQLMLPPLAWLHLDLIASDKAPSQWFWSSEELLS